MIKVAVGLIFRNHEKEVLLCQRRADLPYPHIWEFPGGKMKDGEEIEECLKRELLEELDISVFRCKLYNRQIYQYTSGTFDVHYFIVQNYTGTIVNHLFADMKWVPINELKNFDILDGNASTVQKLLNHYEKSSSF